MVEEALQRYMDLVPVKFTAEVAQFLIASELLPLPRVLQERIVQDRQVSQVISVMLADSSVQIPQACDFISENPNALEILVESDLNLAILLMTKSEKATAIFQEHIRMTKVDIDEQISILRGE